MAKHKFGDAIQIGDKIVTGNDFVRLQENLNRLERTVETLHEGYEKSELYGEVTLETDGDYNDTLNQRVESWGNGYYERGQKIDRLELDNTRIAGLETENTEILNANVDLTGRVAHLDRLKTFVNNKIQEIWDSIEIPEDAEAYLSLVKNALNDLGLSKSAYRSLASAYKSALGENFPLNEPLKGLNELLEKQKNTADLERLTAELTTLKADNEKLAGDLKSTQEAHNESLVRYDKLYEESQKTSAVPENQVVREIFVTGVYSLIDKVENDILSMPAERVTQEISKLITLIEDNRDELLGKEYRELSTRVTELGDNYKVKQTETINKVAGIVSELRSESARNITELIGYNAVLSNAEIVLGSVLTQENGDYNTAKEVLQSAVLQYIERENANDMKIADTIIQNAGNHLNNVGLGQAVNLNNRIVSSEARYKGIGAKFRDNLDLSSYQQRLDEIKSQAKNVYAKFPNKQF